MRKLVVAFLVTTAGFPLAGAEESFDPHLIRVAVSQSTPKVDIRVDGHYQALRGADGAVLEEGDKLPPVTVYAGDVGLVFGSHTLQTEALHIRSDHEAAIHLNGTRLRGSLKIVRKADRTLEVINFLPLEEYLRGVLSKEAPDYWPEEALKAIAIAARTYALYRRYTKAAADYDVSGTVMSQDYGGQSSEKRATDRAVRMTHGLILVYDGALFPPFYHSTCGGITENGRIMGNFDIPPLKGGIKCNYCQASPFYNWKRRFTREDVNWALYKNKYGSFGGIRSMRVRSRTPTGRVSEVEIEGNKQTAVLKGYDFRRIFGFEELRSLLFDIYAVGPEYVLEGHGWGHGVGMCQWGAAELARQGQSAEAILAFYYPQTQVVPLASLLQKPVTVIGGDS